MNPLTRSDSLDMERAADKWLPVPHRLAPQPGKVWVATVAVHKCDGVRFLPGQQYQLEHSRAVAAHARGVVYMLGTEKVDWWQMPNRILTPWPGDKEQPLYTEPTSGALKIVSGCGYDPGSQGYRFHSAINQHSKHASVFVRWQDSNPHASFRSLDGERDAPMVREAILTADVVHCHINYLLLANAGLSMQPGQLLIRHYHGSIAPEDRERLNQVTWLDPKWDQARNAIMVGARLTFFQEAAELAERLREPVNIDWLPITVPVARYRALPSDRPMAYDGYVPMSKRRKGPSVPKPMTGFRIAHCPTKRSNKGTDKFLKAVDRLNEKGLQIIPVLMEHESQASALQIKRTCDATFDSFWLGIQTSGLEAGAMGQPCIAGDPDVKWLHEQHVGYCPYTYANDGVELEKQIERLATDPAYYQAEAKRCADYVEQYHDYPAVARRYEAILAKHLKRDDVYTVPTKEAA